MFITFEGIDYSGKSTQFARLLAWLAARGIAHLDVREPGGTEISERVRALLLDRKHARMFPETELFLFSAARAQLVRETIAPALARGVTVVADRFHDSTTAYQGYGRGIPVATILKIHALAIGDLKPDITFLFDIPVEESFRRRALREGAPDRMENANPEFFERVREGFLKLAVRYPKRFVVIDGTQDVDAIHWDVVRRLQIED